MTDFAFEVIDVDEVEEDTSLDKAMPVDTTGKVWCEFCKGYYIEEYHVTRMADSDS